MSHVINFFSGIAELVSSIVGYVVNFFKELVWLVDTLVWSVGAALSAISWIPGEYVIFFMGVLTVIICYKILGREG